MAAVPATITVSFTSNYAGPHRVCYRINNSGTYTCATVVCAGGGASCSYDVGVTVDNETCEDVIFDGYVQAECNDIASLTGRVAFLSTFTPSPSCLKYTVSCDNEGVDSIVLTNNGTKYASAPSVSITGGGGTGATATAIIGTGVVISGPNIIDGGTGYVDGSYVAVPLLGGSGTGATADITVAGGVVISAVINAVGIGYADQDNVVPDPSAMGPSAPTLAADLEVLSDEGQVVAVNVTLAGSGYSTVPLITIAPGAGVTATADAVLAYCNSFNSPGCTGPSTPIADMLRPGDTLEICSSSGAPTLVSNMSVVLNGNCLCACTTYTIEATGTGAVYTYVYNECDGNTVTGTIDQAGSPSILTFCAATDSLVYRLDSGVAGITVAVGGSC